MSGHKKWREIRAQSKADPREVARHRREMEQELSLAELRRARELTQAQLANALDTNQSGISRIEHQTDIYLSTLRSFIEALGGTLEVVAVFPDATVPIRNFEELETESEAKSDQRELARS